MKFGFDLQMYMKVSDDEHVKQLQVLEYSSKDVIRGITVLSQGRLPQAFFSDSRLQSIISEAETMVQGAPKVCSRWGACVLLQRYKIDNFCCRSADPFIDSHFPSIHTGL